MKILRLSIKLSLLLILVLFVNVFALTYTVKPGDSLDKIARKYGVSVKDLIKENNLKKPYIIRPGQKLKIPEKKRYSGYIKYKVKRGDTLSEIAQKFGVSVKEIARLNNLKKPYRLRAGQILKIPKKYSKSKKKSKVEAYRIYKVRKGDSLIRIAKKFGVSTKEIIKANNLKKPYRLKAGQKLKIPIKYASNSKRYKTRKTKSKRDYSYSYCSRKYRVKPGDTLSEIAQKFGVSVKTLKRINGLKSSTLRVGQILCVKKVTKRVYRGSSGRIVKTKYIKYKVKPGDSLIKIAKKFRVYTKDIIKANKLKKPYHLRVGQVLKIPKKVVTYVRREGSEREGRYSGGRYRFGFIWPVNGEVINPFVNNTTMRHLGIDIQANCGAPVKAAESGRVIYAGQSIKPYGKLIVIRHKNGFSSVYGHIGNILVREGQRVRKGQTIGTVGELNEGICGIYFEIRKNTKPLDPLVFLSKNK